MAAANTNPPMPTWRTVPVTAAARAANTNMEDNSGDNDSCRQCQREDNDSCSSQLSTWRTLMTTAAANATVECGTTNAATNANVENGGNNWLLQWLRDAATTITMQPPHAATTTRHHQQPATVTRRQ